MAVSKKPGSPKGTPGKAAKPAKAQVLKKTVKLPTGEKPKQLSTLAKTVKSAARGGVLNKSGKVEVLTPSQAAARAGKMRDKTAQALSTKAPKRTPIRGGRREAILRGKIN